MKRRGFIKLALFSSVLAACSNSGSTTEDSTGAAASSAELPSELVFDSKGYTEKTTTINDVEVEYREWSGVVYVSKPVDTDYQCLNIKQPTKVGGKDVDPSGMPIVFALNIGGYISSSPNNQGGPGGPIDSTQTPPTENPSGPPNGGGDGAGAGDNGGDGGVPSGFGGQIGQGQRVDNGDYALVNGLTVVIPGARGRDNQAEDGTYYGKAPAAIVDLKAAVRYLKANSDAIPGDTNRIVSSGSSAGGALSVLLGASGDSELYADDLKEIGAAEASDAIYASAGYCPITDLEYADAAYAWCFLETSDEAKELAEAFSDRMKDLGLKNASGKELTADNLAEHILETHVRPAAKHYLESLSAEERTTYEAEHSWVTEDFSWDEFISYIGHKKTSPAFDKPDLSTGENILFGSSTENARHFTERGQGGKVDDEVQEAVKRMNPMHFLADKHEQRAKHWFLRVGTKDSDTSHSIVSNLDSLLRDIGDSVDTAYYWDAGHGANEDPDKFIDWVKSLG